MKKYVYIKKVIIGSALGAAALFGAAVMVGAQEDSKIVLKWQAAKLVADTRHDKYLSTGRVSDYRRWQRAENRVAKRSGKLEKAGVDVSVVVAKNDLNDTSTAVEYPKTEPEVVDVNRSDNTVVTTDNTVVANNDIKDTSVDDTSVETIKNEKPEDVDVNRSDNTVIPTNDMNDNDTSMETMKKENLENVDTSLIDNSSTVVTDTTVVKLNPIDPEHAEKARDAVSMGYMEGYRKGKKDRGHKYNDTARMPYQTSPFEPSLIAGHKYKPFYEAGYKRGYEDGYNNTMKYGEVTENAGKKGYSVHASVMDSLVSATS